MEAWNGWLHCSGSTYGAWLRGDPRGWRAQRHREHCEGNYKNPPDPEEFVRLFEQSKQLMKKPGVTLSRKARECACRKMLDALRFHGVEVIALCVGGRHWHGLLKCPPDAKYKSSGKRIPRAWRNGVARHFMGIAKKESARALSRERLAEAGGVWARGCGVKPAKNRQHQKRVAKYVYEHRLEGAYVWTVLTGFVSSR